MKLHGMGSLTAALGLVCTFSLQGCITPLVRDQAQVDPVVASVFGTTGFEQPMPIIPDCKVSQWVERALEGGQTDCKRGDADFKSTNSHRSRDGIILKPLMIADPTQRRTQVQAELMTYADLVCDRHLAGIYASNAGLNFVGGLGTTLLSGAAAIASGRSATNLAAGSALFSGTRSLMNSEIYYGYIGPAVITELRALRTDLRAQIGSKRGCTLNSYPPQEAINDALTYHDACSFATGLASLLNKAGVTRVSEDKLRTGQIAVITQQLTTKKVELAEIQKAINADPGTDTSPGALRARSALREKERILVAEIGDAEAVQRFAGVVDPSAGQAARPLPRDSVEKLQMAVKDLEKESPASPELPGLKTQLAAALVDMGNAAAAELQIRIMQRRLYDERKLLASIDAADDPSGFAAADAAVIATERDLAKQIQQLIAAGGSAQLNGDALTSTGQDCTKPVAQSGTGR